MDVDSIPFGLDFRKHIREVLNRCDTMLAVVGPSWAGTDEVGQSRLAEETDWVRIEIEAALAKDIPVIPVLINGARMPKPQELPETMQDFAFRQSTEIDMRRDFHSHMDRLIRVMDQLLRMNGSKDSGEALHEEEIELDEAEGGSAEESVEQEMDLSDSAVTEAPPAKRLGRKRSTAERVARGVFFLSLFVLAIVLLDTLLSYNR